MFTHALLVTAKYRITYTCMFDIVRIENLLYKRQVPKPILVNSTRYALPHGIAGINQMTYAMHTYIILNHYVYMYHAHRIWQSSVRSFMSIIFFLVLPFCHSSLLSTYL